MSFVRLENLNDFIQPSTGCVKPTEKKIGVVAKVGDINLSDCLACSGCITSAETILVQQQNYEELFKIINENKTSAIGREIVVSLSLQSVASLGSKYEMDALETSERLASFLVSLGCDKVYDINVARHLALMESHKEYENLKQSDMKGPILTSICPGWICYAEKTNGDLIIPQLSKVRSPQQIMGALIKKLNPKAFHVTLMPCFDKKLEASRQDFKHGDGVQDVDCVLTPLELEEIIETEGVCIRDFDQRALDTPFEVDLDEKFALISHRGSTSGGYAENILLTEARKHLGFSKDLELNYTQLKNSDFVEVTLKQNLECDLPRIAIVNGFRNIQTIVQRLKRNALNYDYIQIMACPSGCINGGAQCKTDMEKSTDNYKQVPCVEVKQDHATIYKKLNLDPEVDLRTRFHAVPKMQNLTVNW